MADVAKLAGVSTTAVSLVINDRQGTRLSPDAASRVRAAADELGYRPNLTARSLSTQQSHVLGFISEQVTIDRLASGLIQGALKEAKRHGHVLFIAETEGEEGAIDDAIDALVDRQVDGIIYAATRPQVLHVPARVGATPVVMLNALSERPDASVVLADEYAGAEAITQLLVDAGHRENVVILGRSLDQDDDVWLTVPVRRRLEGIWHVLNHAGITPITQIPCQPWSVPNGYQAIHDLLQAGIQPGAIICLNDRLAFGAYRALTEVGLKVGRDVATVSFDDDDIAVYLDPMLTTAAAPYEAMGAKAVQLVLDHDRDPGEHLVAMPLRVRGSVKIPARVVSRIDHDETQQNWTR